MSDTPSPTDSFAGATTAPPPVTVEAISFSFYTGSERDYAADPRGRSEKWRTDPYTCAGEVFDQAKAARAKKLVSHRNAGTLRESIGNSWEVEDHLHLTPSQFNALSMVASRCRGEGITFAVSCGLNAPDGLPLDMAIASHRASFVRRCRWLRNIGATECWMDTGGDISFNQKKGDGVYQATTYAADAGITLVPEFTTNLPPNLMTPTYHRIRRVSTNEPKLVLPFYGRDVYAQFGFNGGGMETPEELRTYLDKGIKLCAYNTGAREWAVAQAQPFAGTTK